MMLRTPFECRPSGPLPRQDVRAPRAYSVPKLTTSPKPVCTPRPLAGKWNGLETIAPEPPVSVALNASQALGLWHQVSLAQVQSGATDLTMRQMAILLHIYLVPPPHTVRGLAATLGVTKPVITRALDTMGEMGIVDRVRDTIDRRNVVIKRTVAGALFLEKFGDLVIDQARHLS
jgi:DNA-binding MarR family transcriptional regulator